MRPVFLFLMLALAGCQRTDVEKHPLLKRAEECRLEGDYQGAANGYKRLLEKYADSPVLHLKMATLCDEFLNRPDGAIYHYEEYLALTPPDAVDREQILAYRDDARKRLAESVSNRESEEKIAELQRENEELRKHLNELKRHLYSRRQSVPAPQPVPHSAVSGIDTAAELPGANAGEMEIYTVQEGDTPGKIARKFYGSASRYPLIMEANKLKGATGLRIGQKLKIPKVKK